jgi:hypothetical protein
MNYLICQDFVKILSNEKEVIKSKIVNYQFALGGMSGVSFNKNLNKNKNKYKLICELIDIFNNCEL